MKILIAHIPYEHRGGEDVHVEALAKVYQELGYEVRLFPENRTPSTEHLNAAVQSLVPGKPPIASLIEEFKPDVVHLHNAFPVLGPRFYAWATKQKFRLIQTIHNHRFYCTNGLAYRSGKVCKACFDSKIAWRPVLYNCNGSFTKSVYHALAIERMHMADLYRNAVQRFIAPSPYIASELKKWGVQADRVAQIFNPIPDENQDSSGAVTVDVFYAGRLSGEKGIQNLLKVAAAAPDLDFAIAGDGPMKDFVAEKSKQLRNLKFLGPISQGKVRGQIQKSKVGILPSVCNEILPTFVLENIASGKRCVVPDMDSTRYFSDFGAVPADTAKAELLLDSVRQAIALGDLPEAKSVAFRKLVSRDQFKNDLAKMLNGLRK